MLVAGNNIGDDGARALSEALHDERCCLTQLNLWGECDGVWMSGGAMMLATMTFVCKADGSVCYRQQDPRRWSSSAERSAA